MNSLKRFLKSTSLYKRIKENKLKKELESWERLSTKRGPLPHLFKQFTIKDYAIKYKPRVLIETGTFQGDMVNACLDFFDKIFSIELQGFLYEEAKIKFRKYPKVTLVQGDSGIKLEEILKTVNEPCIFWLDGHYSAGVTAKGDLDTPITKEIETIFKHSIKNHVILIDDARCFVGENDYPELNAFITQLKGSAKNIEVEVYNDIIRITPN